MLHEKESEKAKKSGMHMGSRPPYWQILKDAGPQLFNVFFVFFVTLSIFPTVHSGNYIVIYLIIILTFIYFDTFFLFRY